MNLSIDTDKVVEIVDQELGQIEKWLKEEIVSGVQYEVVKAIREGLSEGMTDLRVRVRKHISGRTDALFQRIVDDVDSWDDDTVLTAVLDGK